MPFFRPYVGQIVKPVGRWLVRWWLVPRLRSATGGIITGTINHGADQLLWRDGLRGVATAAIIDAVGHPIQVVTQPVGTTLYKGKMANVVLSQRGHLVTAYAKGRGGQRWHR